MLTQNSKIGGGAFYAPNQKGDHYLQVKIPNLQPNSQTINKVQSLSTKKMYHLEAIGIQTR